MIILDDLFQLSLHGRCLNSLDHHDLLVPNHGPLQLPNIVLLTLLKLSQILHDIVFEPLSILSDFEDKSQYYFPNINVSGKNLVREQFCHQLDFFDLQTVKKLQLIDSAACRKLRLKLAKMKLIDFCIIKGTK